jgi:hypothetical protein
MRRALATIGLLALLGGAGCASTGDLNAAQADAAEAKRMAGEAKADAAAARQEAADARAAADAAAAQAREASEKADRIFQRSLHK